MCSLDNFKIDLKGLHEGSNLLSYDIHDGYFQAVQAAGISGGDVRVDLNVQRTGDVFTLDFHTEGTVIVPCDICLDDMEQPIKTDNRLAVKFGEEYSDEDDEVVTVAETEGTLDVAWFIYEFIALAIPVRHVHAEGGCNPAMLEALEQHSASRNAEDKTAGDIDPRWKELEKLKTIIKD
ncbi:MAG: YceD family protein [Prevotella sp.]